MNKVVTYQELGVESGASVAVGPIPDWITVTPLSGSGDGALEVTVAPNTKTETRSYTIVVRSTVSDKVATINVVQAAGDPYLWITAMGQSSDEVSVGAEAGTANVSVLSNTDWRVIGDATYGLYRLSSSASNFNLGQKYPVDLAQVVAPASVVTITVSCEGGVVSPLSFSSDSVPATLEVTPSATPCVITLSCGDAVVGTFECPPPIKPEVGDICLYDRVADAKVIVPGSEFSVEAYPADRYSPLGVVVIPASHDVYGTGECAVISLVSMSPSAPDKGSTARPDNIYWGQYATNTPLPDLDVAPVVKDYSAAECVVSGVDMEGIKLPSDRFLGRGYVCGHDTNAGYYNGSVCIPSPYLTDGSRNPCYYQTAAPSSAKNCLADFNGKGNTEVLCGLATAQSTWKTDSTITNSRNAGYSPAACCCWRYSPEGTQQGDWYLPSMGELGYSMARFTLIDNTIKLLQSSYGNCSLLSYGDGYFWSSTEDSSSVVKYIDYNNGIVAYYSKYDSNAVRAFLRV